MIKKVRYTTEDTIAKDAEGWLRALAPYVRHAGPGSLERAGIVVLDLQRYFVDQSSPAFLPAAPAILPQVRALVEAFRRRNKPIVWTLHLDPPPERDCLMEHWWGRRLVEDDPLAALSEAPGPGDWVIKKASYSAFEGTGLAEMLRNKGVDSVVIVGVQTHLCVETTARHAFVLGLRPVVIADATAAPDLDLHLGSLRALAHGCARICRCAEIIGAASGLERCTQQVPEETEVLVVGAGPAGLAAGIQAHRMGAKTLVIEKKRPGGLLHAAFVVENYPGFPGGIRGEDLAQRMEAHARAVGVQIAEGEVTEVVQVRDRFGALLADGSKVSARAVIIATGTRPERLNIPGEARLFGRLVFYQVDDLLACTPRGSAVVIGGGDCAFDQALHLVHRGWRVALLMRGEKPRALPLLQERAFLQGVEVVRKARVLEMAEQNGKAMIVVEGERDKKWFADAVLIAVGRKPCLPKLAGHVNWGALDFASRSPWPGLFIAGDCGRGLLRQASIACGDGMAAAMQAAVFVR